jgi:DNA-binding GntR family transcriptional regulator
VGRTPLREALRMLQQEGLIVTARNKRPQVVSFDPEVIEAVFAQSILIAALAARVSVPRLTAEGVFCLQFLMNNGFVPWSAAYEDHAALLEVCRAGDGESAAKMLARHFASGALALLAHAMPEREPHLVRAAMRLIVPKPEPVTHKRAPSGAGNSRAIAVQ